MLCCGAMVSHTGPLRVLPSVCNGWHLGRLFSQKVSTWSSPCAAGRWASYGGSLHTSTRMQQSVAAASAVCAGRFCRSFLIPAWPASSSQCSLCQNLGSKSCAPSFSASMSEPQSGSRSSSCCILTALSSTEHKCPRG